MSVFQHRHMYYVYVKKLTNQLPPTCYLIGWFFDINISIFRSKNIIKLRFTSHRFECSKVDIFEVYALYLLCTIIFRQDLEAIGLDQSIIQFMLTRREKKQFLYNQTFMICLLLLSMQNLQIASFASAVSICSVLVQFLLFYVVLPNQHYGREHVKKIVGRYEL